MAQSRQLTQWTQVGDLIDPEVKRRDTGQVLDARDARDTGVRDREPGKRREGPARQVGTRADSERSN
jgi:hypothetical protein